MKSPVITQNALNNTNALNSIRFRQIQSVDPSIRNINRRIQKYGPNVDPSSKSDGLQSVTFWTTLNFL